MTGQLRVARKSVVSSTTTSISCLSWLTSKGPTAGSFGVWMVAMIDVPLGRGGGAGSSPKRGSSLGGRLVRQPPVLFGDLLKTGIDGFLDELQVARKASFLAVGHDENDVAGEFVPRERLLENRLGATAWRILGEKGEFFVLGNLIPGWGGKAAPEQESPPGQQDNHPGAASDPAKKLKYHDKSRVDGLAAPAPGLLPAANGQGRRWGS